MPIIEVNGADLYYEQHGSGETLILTHGSWGDATGWSQVVPRLSERYEVVIWDRRGHSRSSAGAGPHTIDQDAADLAAVIERLDGDPVHLCGTSSGGTVVLKLLAGRPEVARSAAVHEPAVPGLLDDLEDESVKRLVGTMNRHLAEVRAMIERGEDAAAAEYFIDNVAVGPGAWQQFPDDVTRTFTTNAGTYAEEIADPTAFVVDTATLADSEVPLMITLGTESPTLLLSATKELIRRLPSAEVETIEGSGHVPYRTHPDRWVSTLFGFYDKVAALT